MTTSLGQSLEAFTVAPGVAINPDGTIQVTGTVGVGVGPFVQQYDGDGLPPQGPSTAGHAFLPVPDVLQAFRSLLGEQVDAGTLGVWWRRCSGTAARGCG